MAGIRGVEYEEGMRFASPPQVHQAVGLVNLRRSFSPDPALAQALPVPVGHADLN